MYGCLTCGGETIGERQDPEETPGVVGAVLVKEAKVVERDGVAVVGTDPRGFPVPPATPWALFTIASSLPLSMVELRVGESRVLLMAVVELVGESSMSSRSFVAVGETGGRGERGERGPLRERPLKPESIVADEEQPPKWKPTLR